MSAVSKQEFMICTIANLLQGSRHIAVGASSASSIPAAGAMLQRAQEESRGDTIKISILGSIKNNFFTNGSTELFDCAAQGRIDTFFLSGGQIDGRGNINLVGIGDYPQSEVRWQGSFGSAYLYFVIPKVIIFREEHTPRVFVETVDFVSAPGVTDKSVFRKGGPVALLTSKALFHFDKEKARFVLMSLHPGHGLEEVKDATGFEFIHDDLPKITPGPDPETLQLLRGNIFDELAETYPEFVEKMRADPGASNMEHFSNEAQPVFGLKSNQDRPGMLKYGFFSK